MCPRVPYQTCCYLSSETSIQTPLYPPASWIKDKGWWFFITPCLHLWLTLRVLLKSSSLLSYHCQFICSSKWYNTGQVFMCLKLCQVLWTLPRHLFTYLSGRLQLDSPVLCQATYNSALPLLMPVQVFFHHREVIPSLKPTT